MAAAGRALALALDAVVIVVALVVLANGGSLVILALAAILGFAPWAAIIDDAESGRVASGQAVRRSDQRFARSHQRRSRMMSPPKSSSSRSPGSKPRAT